MGPIGTQRVQCCRCRPGLEPAQGFLDDEEAGATERDHGGDSGECICRTSVHAGAPVRASGSPLRAVFAHSYGRPAMPSIHAFVQRAMETKNTGMK